MEQKPKHARHQNRADQDRRRPARVSSALVSFTVSWTARRSTMRQYPMRGCYGDRSGLATTPLPRRRHPRTDGARIGWAVGAEGGVG